MRTARVALDFNCAPQLADALNCLYGKRGFHFIHLEALVAGRSADEMWADAYKKFGGRVVISGDANIAYRPHQAIAFIDNGFISFFPEGPWNHMPGHAKSATLVHAWPRIEAKIAEARAGTCWRVPCAFNKSERELRLCNRPLRALEIPGDVLDKARQQKFAAR